MTDSIFVVFMFQANKVIKMLINKEYARDLIKDFLAEGESLESISEMMELPLSVILNILNNSPDFGFT